MNILVRQKFSFQTVLVVYFYNRSTIIDTVSSEENVEVVTGSRSSFKTGHGDEEEEETGILLFCENG